MSGDTIGYHTFCPHETFNFMLNRLSWDVDDQILRDIGESVSDIGSFIQKTMLEGERAEQSNRLLEAGFLYRSAEFFMPADHPDKLACYDKFIKYFYQETPSAAEQRGSVSYQNGSLGIIDVPPVGEKKGNILFCSGFDGLIEELYGIACQFSAAGYRTVLFEGTGQGSALRHSRIPMNINWEQPVQAVLDALEIDDCTLIGMSLGGLLAPRAAALEPRVRCVVSWGAMYDFAGSFKAGMGVTANPVFKLVSWRMKNVVNSLLLRAMQKQPKAAWAIKHGMHTSGTDSPYGFLRWLLDFNLRSVAARIDQDVLLVMGNQDHLVPAKQLYEQAESLVNASSVTTLMLSEKQHAAQHCQIGNPDLVVEEILNWLTKIDS